MEHPKSFQVAVVGAGPAGLFAAEKLAQSGYRVVLFNRDIKPGGLAEYGIFPDKHKMKDGLRKQFKQILASESICYYGNVVFGNHSCIKIQDLLDWGFSAVLIACGAQGTKWLGIPGEKLTGVYHAKEVVFHYNRLPPFSTREYQVGKRVAIVGVGNVMTDIARYLINYRDVDEILVVARRGPAEIKFDRKELGAIVQAFDLDDLEVEIERVSPVMRLIGQDPEAVKRYIKSTLDRSVPVKGTARVRLRFLKSPVEVTGDSLGRVNGLVVEENTLELKDDKVTAKGLGVIHVLDVDTVIFAIGDRVDEELGLPVVNHAYAVSQNPLYKVDEVSYEVENPAAGSRLEGVFLCGWSRNPSSGLVGLARKDGINAATAVIQYLSTTKTYKSISVEKLASLVEKLNCPIVQKEDLSRLEQEESRIAQEKGAEEFMFSTNEEMLKGMGLKD